MASGSARDVALAVLLRVEGGAWADRALVGEARRAELDPRELGLARQLAFGAVQRGRTLDHVIGVCTGRRPETLDVPLRAILRLGVYQLAYLDRVPDHAAVGASVDLAKRHAPRASGLVNAALRRAAREAEGIVAALPDRTAKQAALAHSYPDWIAQRWFGQFGPETARALLAAGNRPPETALRVNTLLADVAAVAAALEARVRGTGDGGAGGGPARVRRAAGLPDALLVEGALDVHGDAAFAGGDYVAQSRAAQSVAIALDPQPGDRILDLCAAPGGKTSHLAALARGAARITAVEKDATRAERLETTLARLGAEVEVRCADATALTEIEGYDRVLVDPPCSDLGTLALRPDARWRKLPADPHRLARLQRRILDAGARALAPGGTLVYSTCTLSAPENEDQIAGFLADHPKFAVDPIRLYDLSVWNHDRMPEFLQTLPHRDGTDGFFVARLRKAPSR